jgi:hypothetical protein
MGKLVFDWIDKDFRLAADTLLILMASFAGDHNLPARRSRRTCDQATHAGAAGMNTGPPTFRLATRTTSTPRPTPSRSG